MLPLCACTRRSTMPATMAKKRSRKPGDTKASDSRNVDRHKQARLAFHLPQDLYDAFQSHVESLEPKPAESEVLRLALRQYLMNAGAWPPPAPPVQPK